MSSTDLRLSIALANRLPTGSKYVLAIFADQEGIYCYDYDATRKNCKRLGATEQNNPKAESYYLLKQ